MNNKVRNIHKNARYKVLEVDEEYYILDMTSTYWLFILPFLNWFFSHKAYRIDKSILKEIQSYESNRTNVSAVATIATGFAVMMSAVLRPIFNNLFLHTSSVFNLTLLITTVLLLILFRVFLHHKQWKKMSRHISLKDTPFNTVKVKDIQGSFYPLHILGYVIFWGMAILSGTFFIKDNAVILLITTFIFSYVGLIMNFQSIRAGRVKVKFVENDAASPCI